MKIALHSELEGGINTYPEQLFDSEWYKELCALMTDCIEGMIYFELSIILVDDERIRSLNKLYRGLSRSTDELSFAYNENDSLESGEIYLCPAQALRQRSRFHTTKTQELARLFFHGFLHILGYDHDATANRKVMRGVEDCLMRSAHSHHLW